MANLFLVTIVNMTKKKSTANRTMEEPEVPNPSPPLSGVFVSKSPKVAPNGRVKTNASQNKITGDTFEKKCAITIIKRSVPIKIAPPEKPSPELSARKSPTDVPKVLENKMAVQ